MIKVKWFDKIRARSKAKAAKNTEGEDTIFDQLAEDTVDAVSEEPGPTFNDVSEYVMGIQDALRDTRKRMFVKDYSAPKLMDIISKMEEKVPSLPKLVLPPLIKHALKNNLDPLVKRAMSLGDKYIPKLMDDLDAGVVEHLADYLWLSYLNIIRLSYANEPMFMELREYIKATYGDDIADPAGHTAFLPAKGTVGPQDAWDKVEYLESKGLAVVRETVVLKCQGIEETQSIAIITMSDVV